MKVILFTILLTTTLEAKNFHEDHARGWHWYETKPIPDESKKKENEKAQKPQTPGEILKSYREELQNRLAKAWINPTSENVSSYQEMQKDLMARSKNFSDTWMQNVYTNGNLDHTLVSPVNQKAIHVQMDQQRAEKKEVIGALSKTHGLFFFYASNCPYCHQFAPIVKRFSEMYGWEVLAISLDGGKIEEFPEAVSNNGLAQDWNVTTLPSLFAVNPNTEEVVPIAQGMTSIDEMENRIMSLVGVKR